jgi:hypothetical protein
MKYAVIGLLLALGAPPRGDAADAAPQGAAFESRDYVSLPCAVSSFGAAVDCDWLYTYGGHCASPHRYSSESVVGSFHRLRLSRPGNWEELPSGPALQGLALVARAGKLYRVGGMQPRNRPGEKADNVSVADCACFDPATRRWEALPALPAPRSSHDAVVVGDKLVVVGGWTMKGAGTEPEFRTEALVLDLTQPVLKWQSVKQPFRRRALTAAVRQGKVYVFGGLISGGGPSLAVDVFDPASAAWSSGPNIPGPARNGFAPASSVSGGRLFLSPADGQLLRLSERGDVWEKVGALKQPRLVHRLVAAGDDKLIVLGGASRDGNVAAAEALVRAREPARDSPQPGPNDAGRSGDASPRR